MPNTEHIPFMSLFTFLLEVVQDSDWSTCPVGRLPGVRYQLPYSLAYGLGEDN